MKKAIVITIILIIIAMGLLGTILGNKVSLAPPERARDKVGRGLFPDMEHAGNATKEPPKPQEVDYRGYIVVKSAINMINLTISVILIFLYVNIFRKIKSDFTLGLIIVMFAFLIYAITANPLFYSIFGYWGFGMGPFQMIPDIFTTIALGVLLYLSLK